MASTAASLKGGQSAASEATPLLGTSPAGLPAQASEEPLLHSPPAEPHDDIPLPLTQIFLLCYARLVEPVAFFSIFPFINQMIWETGALEEADVGFYSGLIVRLFACLLTRGNSLSGLVFLTSSRNRYFLSLKCCS